MTPEPASRVKEVIQLDEDQYQHWSFAAGGAVSVSVRVSSGPAVDIYFIDEAYLSSFPKGKEFRYYPALSQEKTRSFQATANVPRGRYVLIVDNTDYGGTMPPMNMVNDRAAVQVEIKSD